MGGADGLIIILDAPLEADTAVAPPEVRSEALVLEVDGTVVLTRSGEENKTVWVARAFDAGGCGEKAASGRPFIAGPSRYAVGASTLEDFENQVLALGDRMGARDLYDDAEKARTAMTSWKELP